MAELAPRERLQPALLDRLIDNEPDQRQESRELRVLSLARLRESVLRDLGWLLSAGSLGQVEQLEDYPLAAQSVLNYGVRNMAGTLLSGTDPRALERGIRQAIWDFEPRIARNTVQVTAAGSSDPHRHAIGFYIEGELWAYPVPLRLFLKTEVDLETGDTTVSDQGEARPA